MKSLKFFLAFLIVFVIACGGYYVWHDLYLKNNSITENDSQQKNDELELAGDYSSKNYEKFQPKTYDVVPNFVEGSTLLKDASNFESLESKYGLSLSSGQKSYLDKNGFLLVDISQTKFKDLGYNFNEMLSDFDSLGGIATPWDRKPEDTVFVNPDIVLEAYHKYFEMTLELLEQKELSQALGDFISSLHSNLAEKAKSSTGIAKERYQNLEAEIVLARVLLENKNRPRPAYYQSPDQEEAYANEDKTIDTIDNAKIILAKYSGDLPTDLVDAISSDLVDIYKAESVGKSALFGQYSDTLSTDFTQFGPRSHYTKSSTLRAFFRTMMYLGRSSYFFKTDKGIMDIGLLAREFSVKSSTGIKPIDPWNKIMSVTSFYAGVSDDIGYPEWKSFVESYIKSGSDMTDSTTVSNIANNLDKLRLPKILSDVVVYNNIGEMTKADLLRDSLSFRIFGQRFSFDAWILNDLTAGQEKTSVKLPSMPSAIFVPASMGDVNARLYASTYLSSYYKGSGGLFSKTQATAFLGKLDEKRADIEKVRKDEWLVSFGSAWLYVLGSLTHTFDSHYPKYMQSKAFSEKQIQTFLGSYAELKHDTILYAKQSYAELGAGGPDEPPPPAPIVKGFVEPNMDFWNRMNELIADTQNVFSKNGLFVNHPAFERLKEFSGIIDFYSLIAKKEITNEKITDDEYEKLRNIKLGFMAQPFDTNIADQETAKSALIADVHTDATVGQILYQATGRPYLMLAIVGDSGATRVVTGLAYNHYELTGPLAKRYTDEDWKKRIYDTKDIPAKNFWYASLGVK